MSGGPGSEPGALPVARLAAPAPSAGASAVSEAVAVSRLAGGGEAGTSTAPGGVIGWTAAAGFAPVPAGFGPVVQRAVEIGEVSSAVEAPGGGASSPAGAGAGDAGGAGGAGQDYEEIADRVYDRIRSRFATELLLDRERMGLLIDG
jgi:hypothetical protein